jgi:hypothetical protein
VARDPFGGEFLPDGTFVYWDPESGEQKQLSKDEVEQLQGHPTTAVDDTKPTATAQPTADQKKITRDIDSDIDELVRTLRRVSPNAAPAYVKYIRDRLDQTFGPAGSAPAAPATQTGTGPVSIGGQKLDPRNPQDAKLIAAARKAAGAVTESLVWTAGWDPSQKLLDRSRHGS